jgi:hypothetical protein
LLGDQFFRKFVMKIRNQHVNIDYRNRRQNCCI